ncbi:MAG TPA: hypothetical protein VE907_08170 [Gammaproteobacteria bacterium]|nr:hypothetical protein [Gammaproteobacteria bacterium]
MKKTQAAGRMPVPVQAPLINTAPKVEPPNAKAGWDPYEVWRTRVLLPPVAGVAAQPLAVESNVKPLLRQSA